MRSKHELAHYILSQARFFSTCDKLLHRQAIIPVFESTNLLAETVDLLRASYHWAKNNNHLESKINIAYDYNPKEAIINTYGDIIFPTGLLMQLINNYEAWLRQQLNYNNIINKLKAHLHVTNVDKIIANDQHPLSTTQKWLQCALFSIFHKAEIKPCSAIEILQSNTINYVVDAQIMNTMPNFQAALANVNSGNFISIASAA
jgi:hypothetical protein